MRTLAAAMLVAAGCSLPPAADDVQAEEAPEAMCPETSLSPSAEEGTGEAQQPVTADECWAAYEAGEVVCQNSPPDAAMGCFLAIRGLLLACLKSAR